MAKKIITTLEQYNKKYRNRRYRLLKVAKKEVEDFDKKFKYTDHYLLKGRKWVLIDGTYYEIPKAPRYTWFRNLHAACQAGTCVLAAGIVATAVTLPIVLNNNSASKVNENQWKEAISSIIDATKERNVTVKHDSDINLELTMNIGVGVSYTVKRIELEDATLKIVNDTEYEKTKKTSDGGNSNLNEKEITNIEWYQKTVSGKIKSKKYENGTLTENWDDNENYISSEVGLNEMVSNFDKFAFKDNCYIGTIEYKEIIEEIGIEFNFSYDIKAQFENKKLKNILATCNSHKKEDITIHGITMPIEMTIICTMTTSFSDYGTTSFEMPE